MENLILGFLTGGSLILVIGPQNLFVIEQGLKKNFVFTITTICAVSDILLIFLGIFIYHIFNFITLEAEVILNIILIIFLMNYIKEEFKSLKRKYKIKSTKRSQDFRSIIIKTLGFTYLNPHVYSDTVFFLGNLSKNFELADKYSFGVGASISSFIFFFTLGYLSKFTSNYLKSPRIWKIINNIIILFMGGIALFVVREIINYY